MIFPASQDVRKLAQPGVVLAQLAQLAPSLMDDECEARNQKRRFHHEILGYLGFNHHGKPTRTNGGIMMIYDYIMGFHVGKREFERNLATEWNKHAINHGVRGFTSLPGFTQQEWGFNPRVDGISTTMGQDDHVLQEWSLYIPTDHRP